MNRERELLKRTLNFILPDEYENDESLDYALLLYTQISDLLAQPEQDLKLDWYRRGYEQGFVDGQDVPHNRLKYFTELLFEGN